MHWGQNYGLTGLGAGAEPLPITLNYSKYLYSSIPPSPAHVKAQVLLKIQISKSAQVEKLTVKLTVNVMCPLC